MAEKQNDVEMNGEDFSQDVKTDNEQEQQQHEEQQEEEHQQDEQQQNGGNSISNENDSQQQQSSQQNGTAETPGRDDDRKLFVGGLSWETTEKELREHFGKYGTIESINVKTDSQTGRSRGFAFIVYSSPEAIDKVVAVSEHVINNKKVDPKKAKAKHGKIFVGGLPPEISDDEIKMFFSKFGNIVEVEMPFDKQKSQRKGFCFITFDSEQVVNELLKTPKQTISGKEVDVKKATPKAENVSVAMMRGGGRGGSVRGSGRGGRNYSQGWGSQGYGYGQGYGYSSYDGYGSGGYDYYGGYGGYGGYDYTGYNYGKYSHNQNYHNVPHNKSSNYHHVKH